MEQSVHEEPVKTKIPEGIGERVWKRVARQLDSPEVVEQWDKATLRIIRGARPEYTEEQLKDVAERWHLLARGMGFAASTVDIALASIFVGKGGKTIAGMRFFSPIDYIMNGGKSPGEQRRDAALHQIASGSPFLALAGATVAVRPARLGLSLAGKVVGAGGERITGIINAITQRSRGDVVFYGAGVAHSTKQ